MRQKLRVHIEDKYLKMPEMLDNNFPLLCSSISISTFTCVKRGFMRVNRMINRAGKFYPGPLDSPLKDLQNQ